MAQYSRQQIRTSLLALALAAACSDNVPTSTPVHAPGKDQVVLPPPDNPVVHPAGDGFFSDLLVPIDPRDLALESSADELAAGKYRFRITRVPERMPAVGDVILGAVDGHSYLRRVNTVSREAEEITFETFGAQLHEVVNGGTYHASGGFPSLAGDPAGAVQGGVTPGPGLSPELPSA